MSSITSDVDLAATMLHKQADQLRREAKAHTQVNAIAWRNIAANAIEEAIKRLRRESARIRELEQIAQGRK